MKLAVQVKLLPSAGQAEAMRATLHAANDAANRVSKVAHEKTVSRNFALRKHTYEDIRAAGLGSQAAQHVIKKVADAYRALHSNIKNGNYGKPVPFTCSAGMLKALTEFPRGESDLLYRDDMWLLIVTVDVPGAALNDHPAGWLGAAWASSASPPPATVSAWQAGASTGTGVASLRCAGSSRRSRPGRRNEY